MRVLRFGCAQTRNQRRFTGEEVSSAEVRGFAGKNTRSFPAEEVDEGWQLVVELLFLFVI